MQNETVAENYLIFKDENKVCAKNGEDGQIECRDKDIGIVINELMNELDINNIIIREGNYILNTPIIVEPKVSIIGSGRNTVIQRAANSSLKMIKFNFVDIFNVNQIPLVNTRIGDFYLDGNARNGGSGWAIYLGEGFRHNPDFVEFKNIDIYNSDGIGCEKGVYWNKFNNVNIWNPPNKCVDLSIGDDFPNLNTFYGCRFTGNATSLPVEQSAGIGVITHGTNNSFIMCDFSSLYIAFTGKGYRHMLISPWFELNNTAIDTTEMYQLVVMNPRTAFSNNESGVIIEGRPITYIGTSAWKYGGNDNTVETMIRTNWIDSLAMPFRSFQLGAPRLVWSAAGNYENILIGTNGPKDDNTAYRGKSILLNNIGNIVRTSTIPVPNEPPGLQHATYITRVRLRLSEILQNTQWGIFRIRYYDGSWNELDYSIIPADFPDIGWHEIATQFSTKGWNQFYIEVSKIGNDLINCNVDMVQIEPGNIIGFYTPSYDIRPNGKIVLKDDLGNIRIILNKNNSHGYIGLYDSVAGIMKYAYINSGTWIISDNEPV